MAGRVARPAARLEQPARPGAPYACGLPRMGAGQVLDGLRPVRPARAQFPGLPARGRPRACSGGPGRQVGQVPVSLDTTAGGGSGWRPLAPRSGCSGGPGPASGVPLNRYFVSLGFLPLLADAPAGGPGAWGRDMIAIGTQLAESVGTSSVWAKRFNWRGLVMASGGGVAPNL